MTAVFTHLNDIKLFHLLHHVVISFYLIVCFQYRTFLVIQLDVYVCVTKILALVKTHFVGLRLYDIRRGNGLKNCCF